MGIHDRDYMQAGPARGPLYLPGRLVWLIIAINAVLWIVYSSALNAARTLPTREAQEASFFAFLVDAFLLHPDAVFARGKVWQLVTNFWFHAAGDAQHVIFNMLIFFFFGRTVETYLGPKRFLTLYVGAGVFASLVFVLWSWIVGSTAAALGASGAVYAILVWAAFQHPHRKVHFMMVLPIPMWLWAGVLMVGMEVLAFSRDPTGAVSRVSHISHLAGAAFGALYWWLAPRFSGGGNWRRVPSRPAPPRAAPPPQAPSELEEAQRRTAMRMAMDKLLDKINTSGVGSLTEDEKAFLEKASRELRGR